MPIKIFSKGKGLTGLKNLGNSCYQNSIVQCLSNIPVLNEYIRSNLYSRHINAKSKTRGRIIQELAEVIKILWDGRYQHVSAWNFRSAIGQSDSTFNNQSQQDSHEFLTILIDWLHLDLQTLPAPLSESDSPSEEAWIRYTKKRESAICRYFFGQTKSSVTCQRCGYESNTYETFSNISLELPATKNRCRLNDCLNLYFEEEQIRGWDCPHCGSKQDAVKKLNISRLPQVLVIHLKRFSADPMLCAYRKRQTYVEFPLARLNLSCFIAEAERRRRINTNASYDLCAVSNHYGSMESGHYTAFCRSSTLDKWYKFDDQKVTQLDRGDVNSSAAYILFYQNQQSLQEIQR